MPIQDWVDAVNMHLPQVKEVTRGMVEAAVRQAQRYPCDVRLAMGKISTTEQLEERRRAAQQPFKFLDDPPETDYSYPREYT